MSKDKQTNLILVCLAARNFWGPLWAESSIKFCRSAVLFSATFVAVEMPIKDFVKSRQYVRMKC